MFHVEYLPRDGAPWRRSITYDQNYVNREDIFNILIVNGENVNDPDCHYRIIETMSQPYRATGAPLTDAKAALNSGIKPDITHTSVALETYNSRNSEYGAIKYEPSNYLRPTAGHKEDFLRLLAYLAAAKRHLNKTVLSMRRHMSQDPELQDWAGMQTAAFAIDTDPGNDKVGPSKLPHLGGTVASLNMGLQQAVDCGLLPEDPGQPWTK